MASITETTYKNRQNVWSFRLSVFFTILFGVLLALLVSMGRMPRSISLFDASIIGLAVFRMTRLFVYDSVARWIRDLFVIKEEKTDETGALVIVRRKYDDGFLRNISDLLSCPWCVGVWLSLFAAFFYFATPLAWFPLFVLAVAGFSSLIQISINLIGWRAEQAKLLVENGEEDTAVKEYF